ncbi:MAG: hypothetical protein J3K34DRAFT_435736 [Monoraphidium minutum]|nr:MAG: hypothetical protein J3K34DRAFT_435736 [Monoraphidium minutum]
MRGGAAAAPLWLRAATPAARCDASAAPTLGGARKGRGSVACAPGRRRGRAGSWPAEEGVCKGERRMCHAWTRPRMDVCCSKLAKRTHMRPCGAACRGDAHAAQVVAGAHKVAAQRSMPPSPVCSPASHAPGSRGLLRTCAWRRRRCSTAAGGRPCRSRRC